MNAEKIKTFMALAGQSSSNSLQTGTPEQRKLGAQLLLSEVLEYVIHGLGVTPQVGECQIHEPDEVQYLAQDRTPDRLEMVDGLADVAYTMYWNACAFGIPLEDAFELVCDNNLEKFVQLEQWQQGPGPLEREQWNCGKSVEWPAEVVQVEVIGIETGAEKKYYAVGKDAAGKVRKPLHFRAVDLSSLIA